MNLLGEIRSDVSRCDSVIQNKDFEEIKALLREFEVTYKIYWDNLHFQGPSGWVSEEVVLAEIKGFRQRLDMLSHLGHDNIIDFFKNKSTGVTVNNSNSNLDITNINISIEIVYDDLKYFIEQNGTLSEEQRIEALDKADNVKAIAESTESKVKKWDKLKPVFEWLLTKGVDVFIKFIPLIVQALA